MFLRKQDHGFDKSQFYFDGARIIDGLVQYQYNAINNKDNTKLEMEYLIDEKLKDIENIELLKEELGTNFIEVQMFQTFTRNNENGDKTIKNNFQKNLYTDLQKQNNFLASMFLYFFHKFLYNEENHDDLKNVASYKNSQAYINIHKTLKTHGLATADIIEEIKSVYPYLHNLFVKLLEIKYGEAGKHRSHEYRRCQGVTQGS
ncbi:hypothetical protein ABPG74_003065 [Tetrahymena malaccensis]